MNCGLHRSEIDVAMNCVRVLCRLIKIDFTLCYYVSVLRSVRANRKPCLFLMKKESLSMSNNKKMRTCSYLQDGTDLFIDLLYSMRKRFDALKIAKESNECTICKTFTCLIN